MRTPGDRVVRYATVADLLRRPAHRNLVSILLQKSATRMARRLKAGSWAYARAYQNSDQRTAELSDWLHRYNWHRPHGSLKANTPISRLGLSEDNVLRLHS